VILGEVFFSNSQISCVIFNLDFKICGTLTENMSTRGSSGSVGFDFNSEQGVLVVLQSIRASEIGAKEQRELRDLVFSYAHSRGDAGLRNELEKRLTQLGITPVSLQKNQKASNTPKEVVSGRRPTPTFKVTHRAPTKVETPEIPPQKAKVDTPIAPPNSVTAPVRETTFIPHNITEPVRDKTNDLPTAPPTAISPEPQSVAVKITPRIPGQGAENLPDNTQPTPTTALGTQSVDQNQVPKQTPNQVSKQPEEIKSRPQVGKSPDSDPIQAIDQNPQLQMYLDRIRDIKTDINARVGNPVNLVDIDNETGREYMSALLEAMKQISAGGNPVGAMQRLEVAYKKALTVIAPELASEEKNKTTSAPTGFDFNPPTQVVAEQVNNDTVPIPSNINTQLDQKIPSTRINVKPAQEIEVSSDHSPSNHTSAVAFVPPKKIIEEVTSKAPGPKNELVLDPHVFDVYEPETEPVKVSVTPPVASDTETVKISSSRFNLGSVADATPLKKPDMLPTADEVNTAEAGVDPLHTKEVDDGLTQLLMEWSLFNKSGFLGRGPKGREHPLFIQLASMPIPLILSGRFEGSAPHIMQSVSDYMNGWRYEQGVVYTENEPFEHYLRRVIRHIIDWQRKKKQA